MRKDNHQEEQILTEQDNDQAEQQANTEIDEASGAGAGQEEYKAKAEEYYQHMQRLKAEFDNYRKRTQKEKEESVKYASEKVILALLPVIDNLERAVESAHHNKDFEAFAQGVEMIYRQCLKVLEDEGLKPIEAVGVGFDPNVHEALFREDSEYDENTILAELQKGYYLKDKVIRPSKVKVSS